MGFMNPDLITRFDIDPAKARQSALVNQGLQQGNQLRGMQIAQAPEDRNYLRQQREQAAIDKPIMDARAGALFLGKAMPTIPDVGSYYGQRDALIGKFGVPEELLPDQATIQGLAVKNGIDEQAVFERIKNAYSPQATKTGGLSEKNTQEVDFYDEKAKRWMVQKQRYDPVTKTFRSYSTGPKSTLSQEERQRQRLRDDLPKIQSFLARKGPMATYADKYKMHDDGTLYLNARGLPEELPSFEKVTGKRGNIKAIIEAGNQLDDGIEVIELLQDPQVQADMKRVIKPGLLGRIKNMGQNKLRKWAQEMGIGANTKSYETLVRIQRMSSEERKRLLGAAVTTTELKSILSWMPDAGDNYESIVAKMNVGVFEAYEGFRHWIDAFKHDADMSPFYRAFGWDRFNMPKPESFQIKIPDENAENISPIDARGAELEKLGFPDEEILTILKKEFGK